jgi:hypothetical protein
MQNNTQTINLKALKLRPGMSLQIQGVSANRPKEEAQFLAAIENKGFMLSPHNSGTLSATEIGAECVVSGFTGLHDFSFASRVIQSFENPFVYTLLTYPHAVSARQVRYALRLKISHPAKVILAGQAAPLDVMLVDISKCGSMVHSSTSLGAVGEIVRLSLSFHIDGEPANLTIPSTICHSNKAQNNNSFNVGLAFKPVSQNDKLLLYYLAQSSSQ